MPRASGDTGMPREGMHFLKTANCQHACLPVLRFCMLALFKTAKTLVYFRVGTSKFEDRRYGEEETRGGEATVPCSGIRNS